MKNWDEVFAAFVSGKIIQTRMAYEGWLDIDKMQLMEDYQKGLDPSHLYRIKPEGKGSHAG